MGKEKGEEGEHGEIERRKGDGKGVGRQREGGKERLGSRITEKKA